MTKYVIMRERRKKAKRGEPAKTYWTLELRIPKLIDRLKKPVSLYGLPPYMNEKEAEAIARALTELEFEKRPLKGKPFKQMKLPMRRTQVAESTIKSDPPPARQFSEIEIKEIVDAVISKLDQRQVPDDKNHAPVTHP